MVDLIACLGSGKGSWQEVFGIINKGKWDKVYLITDKFWQERVKTKKENMKLVVVDSNNGVKEIIKQIKEQLEGKINGLEIGLNLISGTGKEHMAIIQAVMELGLNFRLVGLRNQEILVF